MTLPRQAPIPPSTPFWCFAAAVVFTGVRFGLSQLIFSFLESRLPKGYLVSDRNGMDLSPSPGGREGNGGWPTLYTEDRKALMCKEATHEPWYGVVTYLPS
jgi:hypothetical protein